MLCNPRSVRFQLAMPLSPRLGEDPFQASRDVDFRLHTHDAIHLAAGAEDQQCWNATHVEARCGHRVLVHIQLRDTPLPGYLRFLQFLRDFRQQHVCGQAALIFHAAVDPTMASRASQGELATYCNHFGPRQPARHGTFSHATTLVCHISHREVDTDAGLVHTVMENHVQRASDAQRDTTRGGTWSHGCRPRRTIAHCSSLS